MSQQSSASMNLLQQQTHVAQQSRRDKLRIPGPHHPSSPQNYDHSEHSQQSVTAHLGPSSGYLQGYSTNIGQSNIGNAIPTYASYMISSDTYNCPDGAESLALPAKNTGCFVAESVEKSPFVGTIYSGQSQTPMRFNGQANEQSKEGSWISGGPQLGMMTNNGFMNPPSTLNGTTTAVTSAVAANLLSAPSIQTSTYAMNSREGSMGTYFTGSSSQADSVQAFYLMNPGIAGYTDTMASGNMVLINHTTGSALPSTYFTGNGQLQQHFIGIPLSTPSPSQCSSMGAVQNSPAEQQNTTSSLLASRLGAHAYNSWQGGGNELTFLQTTDATSSNQSMSGQLNSSVNLGSQSVTEISQLALRHASMSSLEEQQSGILSSGLGLRLDQPQGSAGRGQGLSLSLSPHQRSTVQLPSFQNQPGELDGRHTFERENRVQRQYKMGKDSVFQYPKDADKHMLARQAGLTRGQVSNWFINARVRLWKPMVEEMYMEENKEAELGHVSSEKAGKESAEDKEDAESEEGSGNSQNAHDQELTKAMQLSSSEWKEGHKQQNDAASVGLKSEHSSDMMNCRNQTFSMDGASDEEVSHEAREEGMRQGQLKKARNGIQDTTHLLCTNLGTVEDFKSKETHPEDICDKFSDETQVIENYSLVKNSIVHADNSRSFGSYQIGRLNRYGQDSFAPRFPRSGSVSLSLGLPHSDGLSLPGTQQSCISSQGRKHDLSSAADGYCNINETAAVHAANACESNGIQNRKRFATHLVHDFVA